MKFTQPVSMKCSQEQYERDLKEPLLAMGYDEYSVTTFDFYPIIVTNHGGNNKRFSNLLYDRINEYNRYFVDTYNPSLFLALAGMTDSEDGNIGEWWHCTDGGALFTDKSLYKQMNLNVLRPKAFLNDDDNLDGWGTSNKHRFRKATQEEIINQFSNKETNQWKK